MGKYNGPKDRLSRREGFDIFGKGAKLTRLNVLPGVHGPKGSVKAPSQYGRQLREKQKVKRFYGLLEKQFRKYINEALESKGNTADALYALLERRLDNAIFRLGFCDSRPQARQLVSHRHVFVNGKRVNIPSYQVRPGEVITLSAKAMAISSVAKKIEDEESIIPEWLQRKKAAGKIVRLPQRSDVPENFADNDIIEYYSR